MDGGAVSAASDEGALALAERYLEIGRPGDALAALARANADDDPELFHLLRAEALLLDDRLAAAIEATEEGLAAEPESIPLLVIKAGGHERLGQLAAAETALLAALRQLPEEPSLLCRYGRLVARGGHLDKARRLLAEAQRLEPDSGEAARLALLIDHLAGDDLAAAAASRKLLADDPEDTHAMAMLGLSLLERGEHGAARRVVMPAAALEPEHLGELAREARLRAHPLMWPLWPVVRFGGVAMWFVGVGAIFVARTIGDGELVLPVALTYLLWCVYTWVAPPLLRRYLRWRH
jgi:tetratricopeptide (TPR) repeat protein